MASIPFGIEFDRIAPPVPTIAAATEYDAARRRRTIDFFFERLRPRSIGRLQRLDGDPATGRNRRVSPIVRCFGEGRLTQAIAGRLAWAAGTRLRAQTGPRRRERATARSVRVEFMAG